MTIEEIKSGLSALATQFNPFSEESKLILGAVEVLEQDPCDNAVSRQAVLDYIHRILNQGTGKKKSFEFIQKYVEKLPPVNPQYTENEIQKMQDLEQAELEKAYELGKAEGQKSEGQGMTSNEMALMANIAVDMQKKEVNDVLDKLKSEIENHCGLVKENHCKYCSYCNSVMEVRDILAIINKYKAESEDK